VNLHGDHILLTVSKAIQKSVNDSLGPPSEGTPASGGIQVVLTSLIRGTRGYIETIANQANGAYQNGWYDACAVMLRRLLETLIIEAFEKHNLEGKIKNSAGDFLYLSDLIDKALAEPSWNLSRNCKKALPRLKDLGNLSAHSRRFTAQKGDLEPLRTDVRLTTEEFLHLAGLR
jgi:hypothetical protein